MGEVSKIRTEDLKRETFIVTDEEGGMYEISYRKIVLNSPHVQIRLVMAPILIEECEVGKALDVSYFWKDEEEKHLCPGVPIVSIMSPARIDPTSRC